MASGSLAYRPHQDLDTDLTKFGFLVYAGTIRDFHEWEFRAMTRWKQTKVGERSELASKFLDSLRSEAYIIAEDLGTDILFSNDNIPKVVEAVRERLFPLAEQESKELYRLGTQVGGILSRQAGEPMVSYIDRRRRWLRKLQQLDKETHINEAVLTDLLLDNSGLSRHERLMVLTSMGSSVATKDAESALIKMHSRIHTLERRAPSDRGKGRGHPYKGGKGKGKGKGYGKGSQKGTSYTYLSAVEDLFETYQDDAEGTAYMADEGEQDDWVYHGDEGHVDEEHDDTDLVAQTADASLRDVELDVFTSFLCSEGFDENDRESLAFMADIVQSETVAFMARSKAKGKGKPVSAKGAHGYRPRATGLTVEDRRKKLHEIKLRSTCKTCGRKGHWSGDRECPGPGKGTGKVAVAHFAQATRVMDKSTQTCDLRGSPRISSSESESFEPEAAVNYVSLGRDSETEPAAYMGFFDKDDFEESDEELVDDFASQGAPSTEWDTVEYPEGSDQLFRFGMHKGSTYLEVLKNHPDYYHWGLKEEKPSTMLEAWLVWVYRNFDVPPAGGGGPTLRAAALPVEADTLQKARKAVTLEKAPKSKLGLLRADPKGPCQGGCPEHALNRAGSNAHVMKTTCMLCGHRTSVPRPKLQAKSDPNTCEHKRTDNRNSTRSVHRTFCLDCCTVIEEVPQKLFKQNKGLSDQVLNSPLKVQNLTRRQLEEYTFTKFEAGDVVKRFFKHMDKYLMKADQVTSTELSSFLEDAMDHVVEETRFRMEREALRSSAARSSAEVEPPPVPAFSPVRRTRGSAHEPTPASAAALGSSRGSARMAPPSGKGIGGREKFAGMAIGEKDDPQGDITLDLAAVAAEAAQQDDDPSGDISPKSDASSGSELAAPLEEEIAEPRLPLVDPFEDHENVWVMLDEGCNQTCHGTKWRRHSEGVLAGYGLQFLQQKAAGTSFKGIGAAKAVGKYSMPFALLISNGTGRRRDIRLQGELASTELDSPDVLCLLSLQDQVQLGLVKDLRKGTAKVSGYSGQLRLARHVRTGLLLLCVSQFGASVTERHRKFAVDTEAVVIPKRTPKRTVSIPARDERSISIPARDGNTSIPQGDEGVTAYMLSELVRDEETHHKKVVQWRKRRKNFTSKKQKEKHGKILVYHKCPEDVQKELDKSREKEWAKWKEFSAAIIIDDAQYQELIREGHQVIPTQWVELDKNHNKRLLDPTVEAKYKSRLVVRGDLEKGDPRSDSPTAGIEAQNLVFSFAASRKLRIKSLDVTNAYFQGEEIDRVLLLSQPKGGLPGLKPHQHMLARAPIYGSTDGGRRFWKRLRNYLKGKGLRENRIYRALYSFTDADGVVQLLLTSHVDDLLWACDPSCDWIMDDLIKTFKCGTTEVGNFRYCGKEITQDEDFTIRVSCADTTRNVSKIFVDKRRHPGDPLTDSDRTQMKSVAGSLAWVCRQCRPDLSYRVSRIQSASSNGTVADIREANKAVEYAIGTYDRGLVFKSGLLDWKTPGALMSLVVTDASHANESEEMIINEMTSIEGHRSQGARMVFLTDGALWTGDKGSIHPILWASNLVRRVCRSTIQAEAYTLQAGVEDGDVLRAAITDIFGCLDMKRWEATSAKFVKQIWMTDCKSLETTLSNPKCNKHSDKRLSIEIASLRQELWRKAGEKAGDPFYDDYKPADDQLTDIVRWIDTDVMIADPMTKVMEPTKLVEALKTNTLDVEQPLESVVKKRAKQLQRRSTKKEEDDDLGIDPGG
ncbi:Copia protein [Symbiodinium microadriaticum]|uniref:Copia protein n=1 Tax=Symbiodinium microadriaticum TaxID=2951 RepID=A0A1Q9E7M3_SYMMI|nr:Copia protein [Symbiodinium microadriaticum]